LITNKGRNILAKYLIGQAPAYASYLAMGVGAQPLGLSDPLGNYASQANLNFEVLRIPITSRGYVYDDNNVANIVFAGELPSNQRYLFTEIGVYSAKANPGAGAQDSKMIYTFSESENWEYHTEETAVGIVTNIEPLNLDAGGYTVEVASPVFRTNSDNYIFNSNIRKERFENPRFLDRTLVVSGATSFLESDGTKLSLKTREAGDPYYGSHVHLLGINPTFDKNSADDQLRLAFSILSKDDTPSGASVGGVRILIEFASTDAITPDTYARMSIDYGPEDVIFGDNRYIIATTRLGDLDKSPGFTWNAVNSVKFYVMVYDTVSGATTPTPSEDFYVCLDGFRLENVAAQNPLYGLTGYTEILTDNGLPIVKEPNSSNIVEFRFGIDVG
jgi:hypothetical protein